MRFIVFDLSLLFTMAWKVAEGGRLDDASAATVKRINAMREGWDVAIVACDAMVPDPQMTWKSAPSFRTTIDPPRPDPDDPGRRIGYKAHREVRGAPYYEQFRRTAERLRRDGCHVLTGPELTLDEPCMDCGGVQNPNPECLACSGRGFVHTDKPSGLYAEADDVIGWIADKYRDVAEMALEGGDDPETWALRIVSSDFDVAQVIDDMIAVDVLSPHTGKLIKAEDIQQMFGVPPSKIAQYKALAGDTSDGYHPFPGPKGANGRRGPGIGKETAKDLLGRFGGDALAAVRAALADPPPADMKPNVLALLRRGGEEAAWKGLLLAQLRTVLPGLDFAPILTGPAPVLPITSGPVDPDQMGDSWESPADDPLIHGDGVSVKGVAFRDGREAAHTPGANVAPPTPRNDARVAKDSGGAGPHTAGKGPRTAAQADATANGVDAPSRTSASPSPSPVSAASAGEGAADGLGATRAEIVERPMAVASVASGRNERFELAPYGLEPPDAKGAWWLAQRIAEARLFPKFGIPDQILTVIMMGRARGFPALVSLENAYIVGGQVAWKSAFIVGTPMASGHAAYLEIDEHDEKRAVAVTKRIRGGRGKEQKLAFTIEDARAMGYLDPPKEGRQLGSWHRQPAVMLRWRALVGLARMVYYDICGGMFAPDEFRADGHAYDEELQS